MDNEAKEALRAFWREAALKRDQRMLDAIRREFGKDWLLRAKVDADTPRVYEAPIVAEFDHGAVPEHVAEAVGNRVADVCGVVLAEYRWSTGDTRFTFASLGERLDGPLLIERVADEFRLHNVTVSVGIPSQSEDVERRQDPAGVTPRRGAHDDLWDEDQQRTLDLLHEGAEREAPWYDQDDPEVTTDHFRSRWRDGEPPW